MGDGPSSESKSQLPAWYVPYAQRSLKLADKAAQTGYIPYQGPDVAAFNDQQVAGMQQANDWAAAFGGPGAQSANVGASLPKATQYANGITGLSSFPGYQDALKSWQQRAPGQYAHVMSMFIDPKTGKPPKILAEVNKEVKKENQLTMAEWRRRWGWTPQTHGDDFPGPDDGGGKDKVGGLGGRV